MALSDNCCTAVAVRYRFLFQKTEDGKYDLQHVPHEVEKCELPPNEEEIDQEKDFEFKDDLGYLRSLDPKEWKKQDHYKVLGIPNLRYQASEDIIKWAYRRMVLKHHPDKRKALGEEIRPDDDYFTCITMAYETLGTLNRKRAYDSVDPEFDNLIPAQSDIKNEDFFKLFSYYFGLNSRWSESNDVPILGDFNSSRGNVDKFYTFWYNFKSWREFSYEDEEDKDKCTDRDERRFCEKINKAERIRKKKEEMVRIRTLVDLAYSADPRILKFKQDDKERKLAAKRAKQSALQAKKEEEERLQKEAQFAKERAEAEERAKLEARKQEREVQKKALKRERKSFRDICRSNNYYALDDPENLMHMTAADKICEALNLEQLEELNKELACGGRSVFIKCLQEYQKKAEEERKLILEQASQKYNEQIQNSRNGIKLKPEWTQDHIQLLIKAVNLFPAGTNQRWDVVANFINQHGNFADNIMKFNAKEVLAKAKLLQNTDFSKNDLKEAANKQAFNNFEKEKRSAKSIDVSEISQKIDDNAALNKKIGKSNSAQSNSCDNGLEDKLEKPWTATEQQLLEQALKTYPTSTPERWDKIAECVPNRTKKDCMKRYKDLVETIKAKKAAQVGVKTK